MSSAFKRIILVTVMSMGLLSCTTIRNMYPNAAGVGQGVTVEVSGVIGPSFLEPGANLEFDDTEMALNPDTSTEIGFVVPTTATNGPHTVTVTDQAGLLEIILIFPLFKDRTDTATLHVAPPRDIKVGHFEITQGLQRDANDIPLVTGKSTVIRVFPIVADGGSDISGVTAELHAMRNGAELSGSPIIPDNVPIVISSTFSREEPDDSLNFTLQPDWYAHNTDFWVKVNLPISLSDTNPSDNRYPIGNGNTYAAVYNNRDGLSIQWVMVNYDNSNWTGSTMPRTHVGDQETCDWMRSIYPVDPVEMPYDPWVPDTMTYTQKTGTSLDAYALITELNTMYNAASNPADRLYGWTPEGSIDYNGLSDPLWAGGQNNVACGNDTEGNNPPLTSRFRRTFAHEIGHNTDTGGLFHVSRKLQNDEYGFDVLNVDPFNRLVMRKYPQSDPNPTWDLYDFMRGGELEPHAWIAPPHYDYLYNWMTLGFAPDAADTKPESCAPIDVGSAKELLVVRGKVTREGNGNFYPFYRIPVTPTALRSASNLPSSGSHEIRLLDERGNTVRSVAWTPDFHGDDSKEMLKARPFTWIMPPYPLVQKVELRVRHRVVDSFYVAASGPKVSNLEINTIQKPSDIPGAVARKLMGLQWKADPSSTRDVSDAKKLTHQVYYSRDNGRTWYLVSTGLKSPSAEIDLHNLPGCSRCILKVSSSDGYNASTLTSQKFKVEDKAPLSSIVAPRSGGTRAKGGGVLLIGRGFDLEDGALAGKRLTWISDRQGKLGHGEKLVVRNLEVGKHVITLQSKDSAGNETVSGGITVTIVKR